MKEKEIINLKKKEIVKNKQGYSDYNEFLNAYRNGIKGTIPYINQIRIIIKIQKREEAETAVQNNIGFYNLEEFKILFNKYKNYWSDWFSF